MMTILLIIIGVCAVGIYQRHGQPKHTNFYQTTLSLVIGSLLYQVIMPIFSSDITPKKIAKVDFSSTATISKTDPIQRPVWSPLEAKQKDEEEAQEVFRQLKEAAAKFGVDGMKVCGHCGDSDAELENEDYNFIWPLQGKTIQSFHVQGNDGINLSTPEGTPVVAAHDGQVAYAGEELAGYGKLILIRHYNGFVSAYAHNSELLVKKGDRVSQDSIIAKSGHTGNVKSPQLHFELRRGYTPVDPVKIIPRDIKHFSQNY